MLLQPAGLRRPSGFGKAQRANRQRVKRLPENLARGMRWQWMACCLTGFLLASPGLVLAQGKTSGGFGGFGFPDAGSGPQASFRATYELEKDSKRGQLHVTADIQDGWHMYSVTQQPGGPQESRLGAVSDFVEIIGPFTADHPPEITQEDVWPGLPIEEHHGQVTWTAPFQLTKEIQPASTPIDIEIDGQVCMTGGSCVPISEKLEATFSGYFAIEKRVESLKVAGTHATWSATIEPDQVKPGGSAVIKLKAETDKDYHVYRYVPGDSELDFRTLIVATKKAGLRLGTPTTAVELEGISGGGLNVEYYKGPVEWMIPVSVPEKAVAGEYPLELQVAFLTCNESSCDIQAGVKFAGTLNVGSSSDKSVAMSVAEVPFKSVAELPNLATWIDNEAQPTEEPTLGQRASGKGLELWMVFAALAGGFILNFMPCVLPVIGLKLLSFVNQSGSSHARIVSLNMSYVLGILAVMLVLALVNISAKLAGDAFGWGQQFTRIEFQVPMAVLIFAMALSFLGVWEIPIPGFATSSKSGELLEKEGLNGAFFKGVLTTVLATPCSGPFLGTLFGLTLTLSATSILILYALVGIGLGIPYIALCFSPSFIKLLPKPGAWMETLKQVLAFPLLLTVVYFVAMIAPDYRIATLILLIVVWFACWLIGRVPAYAESRRIRAAWLTGLATAALGAVIGFGFFGPSKHDVPWIPYNEAVLAKYRSEGRTVMIEFTARWCLTCQSNMKFAIDRPQVAELVQKNQVVPLLADWSEPSDEILSKLKELDSLSIPLLAIYPADSQAEPIILRDAISESELLKALEDAGPSLGESGPARTAVNAASRQDTASQNNASPS